LHNLAYQALETVKFKKRPGEGAEGAEEGGTEGGGPTQVGGNVGAWVFVNMCVREGEGEGEGWEVHVCACVCACVTLEG
jgi:hypothetical protein